MAKSPKKKADSASKSPEGHLDHGLQVSPTMPYYCTWLPGACPATENREELPQTALTQIPICPPAGAGVATVVPTFIPPCPTLPMVCVHTINPICPPPQLDGDAAAAQTVPRTILTCTGLPLVCGFAAQPQVGTPFGYKNYGMACGNQQTTVPPFQTAAPEEASTENTKPQKVASKAKATQAKTKSSRQKSSKDDLKIIEGIGPKIEQLLNKAGIKTWAELSKAKIGTLRKILSDAGNRYAVHDPGTWAKQAALAAADKMEELRAWQEKLDGGK